MRKKIALGLAVAMAASVGTTAFAAAANPFTDVPTKHWSYNAVQQLAKAGIIDGFNDGQFKGDRAITRYEMAIIVAKAMAKEDKASASQQAVIDKLAAEYSQELANLGVRVKGLEDQVNTLQAKQSNIKFDGYARIRAEKTPATSQNNGIKDDSDRTRVRINMTAPLDDNWAFKARIEYNSLDNTNNSPAAQSATGVEANSAGGVNFASAYVTGKAFGLDSLSVGRVPVWLGQGFIADIKGSDSGAAPDAFVIGKNIGAVNLQAGIGRYNVKNAAGVLPYWGSTSTGTPTAGPANATLAGFTMPDAVNIQFAGLTAPVFDNSLIFDASWIRDTKNLAYKTVAGGLTYTGLQNFTISGEYGQNSALITRTAAQSKAKAYQAKIKYLGADKAQPGTWGTWVAYNKFDANFDAAAFTTTDLTNYQSLALKSTGLKGTEFGVEYTAFKNGILTFKYEGYKTNKDYTANDFGVNKKGYIGQLEVWF